MPTPVSSQFINSDNNIQQDEPLTFEQIERDLSKRFISFLCGRREISDLTHNLLDKRHEEAVKRNADSYRSWGTVAFTGLETASKGLDLLSIFAPQTLHTAAKEFKKATGIKVMSFAPYKDQGGNLNLAKVSEAYSKILGTASMVTQGSKQIYDNTLTGQRLELKGHEDRYRSLADHKKQEHSRNINDELEAIRKHEQTSQRSYDTKLSIVR